MKPNSIWQPNQPRVNNQLDFSVDDPSFYHCVVFRYSQSHRPMAIAAHKQIDNPAVTFYLVFEPVLYFQGPMSWSSADFVLGDFKERKLLIQKGFIEIQENVIDAFVEQHALFTIQKPTFKIQIFAGKCYILKSISPSGNTP